MKFELKNWQPLKDTRRTILCWLDLVTADEASEDFCYADMAFWGWLSSSRN